MAAADKAPHDKIEQTTRQGKPNKEPKDDKREQLSVHAKILADHHDRLKNIEHRLGIAFPPDGMRGEDQSGDGKASGKEMYRRKRH